MSTHCIHIFPSGKSYRNVYLQTMERKQTTTKETTHLSELPLFTGGEIGIRTLDRFNPMPVFKTGAFNQTLPSLHKNIQI